MTAQNFSKYTKKVLDSIMSNNDYSEFIAGFEEEIKKNLTNSENVLFYLCKEQSNSNSENLFYLFLFLENEFMLYTSKNKDKLPKIKFIDSVEINAIVNTIYITKSDIYINLFEKLMRGYIKDFLIKLLTDLVKCVNVSSLSITLLTIENNYEDAHKAYLLFQSINLLDQIKRIVKTINNIDNNIESFKELVKKIFKQRYIIHAKEFGSLIDTINNSTINDTELISNSFNLALLIDINE